MSVDQKFKRELKNIGERTDGLLTEDIFNDKSHLHSSKAEWMFGSWKEAKEQVGVEDNHYEIWGEVVEEELYGKYSFSELKEILSEYTENDFVKRQVSNFVDYMGENIEKDVERIGTTIKIGSYDDYIRQFKEKYNLTEKEEEVLDKYIGKGRSPKVVIATIRYLQYSTKSQRNCADEYDVSPSSIRGVKDEIKEDLKRRNVII